MANFFKPTSNNALADVYAHSISKLDVMQGGTGTFGLYGGDESGNRLILKLARNGSEIELKKSGWDAKIGGQINMNQSRQSAVLTLFSMSGLRAGDQLKTYTADGRASCWIPVNVVAESQGVMTEWNAVLTDSVKLNTFLSKNDTLYPGAQPYLKWSSGVVLKFKGGALSKVNGLAVHTTGNGKGLGATSDGNLVAWRCLDTWNKSDANAHFGQRHCGPVCPMQQDCECTKRWKYRLA
jgi:hypothetical protein